MKNYNYLYFRYTDTFVADEKKYDNITRNIKTILEPISESSYEDYINAICIENIEKNHLIEAKVGGQGLIVGGSNIDYSELEINPLDQNNPLKINNFFQNSLQFDYTLGHVYVPGSSIKGALRAYIHEGSTRLQSVYKKLSATNEDITSVIESMERDLFDANENEPVIYYDSFITGIPISTNENSKKYVIYNSEFITPHVKDVENEKIDLLHTPNPLYILKVVNGAMLNINIQVPTWMIEKYSELGVDIYEDILVPAFEELGVGAKTNTGFGHFKEVTYKGKK